MGNVTDANVGPNGGASTDVPVTNVYVNCSTVNSTTSTTANWTSDQGDYCLLGISDKHHTSNGLDAFDKQYATTRGLAFGISDSDGLFGTKPKDGISRRGNYASLVTDWKKKDGNANGTHDADQQTHSGQTGSGYWLVRGKVKAV